VIAVDGHSGERKQQKQQRIGNFACFGGGFHGGEFNMPI
jgi:hypothetical protein